MSASPIGSIVRRLDELAALLRRNDETAAGRAGVPPDLARLDVDGADLADAVFPPGVLRIPAEQIALAEAYDTTQACARLARLHAMSRADFYRRAAGATPIRVNRLEYRKILLAGLINACATPRRVQSGRGGTSEEGAHG